VSPTAQEVVVGAIVLAAAGYVVKRLALEKALRARRPDVPASALVRRAARAPSAPAPHSSGDCCGGVGHG
jgi:hypothetical protein